MLRRLEISNIALIDKIDLEFGNRLNILTGETGAGKSILINSINAVLGSRLSRDLIRSGTEKAFVQGIFQLTSALKPLLEEIGIEYEEDGMLILSRQIYAGGKNICRVNGTLVTVATLKKIGQYLIDVHGQHDNQSLLRTGTHIKFLDSFAGDELTEIMRQYHGKLKEYNEIHRKLDMLMGDDKERERLVDLLKYQIDEIEKAELTPGEDKELEQRSKLLLNAEKIVKSFYKAYNYLNGSDGVAFCAVDMVNMAVSEIENISDMDKEYKEISSSLDEIISRLEEISSVIRRLRDKVEYNPELLSEIEARLDTINDLKRKYGETIEEILSFSEKSAIKLEEILNSKEQIEEYKQLLNDIQKELFDYAVKMNKIRRKTAEKLEERIAEQLEELGMKKARFKVNIIFDNDKKYTSNGLDSVEFLISLNVGEPLKPMSKIASGGEMSRIMLAIKTILAEIDEVPTLVFDEIDTGVGGEAAGKVGEKLKKISKNHQVICITHLAPIASFADNHYLIEKHTSDNKTTTKVIELKEEERIRELSRLLSGERDSVTTKNLAKEMLKNAN